MNIRNLISRLEDIVTVHGDDTEVIILNPRHEPYEIGSVDPPEDEDNPEAVIYAGDEIE